MSFIWTPWTWVGLSPAILLFNRLEISDVSSSSFWFPCKWRAKERKRQKLSLCGCLVFSSKMKQLTVFFFTGSSGKTASLRKYVFEWSWKYCWFCQLVEPPLYVHPFSSTRLRDFSFVESFFFSFTRSSVVHNSLDQSSRVLFSSAYKSRIFHLRCFSDWTQMLDSLWLHTLGSWRNYQTFRPHFLQWVFLLLSWIFFVSPFQGLTPPRNVDMNASSLRFVSSTSLLTSSGSTFVVLIEKPCWVFLSCKA